MNAAWGYKNACFFKPLAHHSISTSLATTTRCKNSFAHSPDYTQPPPSHRASPPHLCCAVSQRGKNILFHHLQSVAFLSLRALRALRVSHSPLLLNH